MTDSIFDHVQYRAVQTAEREWTVFIIDDREPEWWRLVARFPSKDRAEAYAYIENDIMDDDTMRPAEVGDKVPAMVPPPSGIVPGTLTRRESVTHTRIEREETVALREPQREILEAVAVPERQLIEAAPESPGCEEAEEPLPEPVDAATLPPLTPIQFKVFSAFVAAKGDYLPAAKIDEITGHKGAFGSLDGVVTKGYLRRRKVDGRIYHDVAVFGAPRIFDPKKDPPHAANGVAAPVPKPKPQSPPPPEHQAVIAESRKHPDIPLENGKFDPVAYLQKKGLNVERDGEGYREGRERYSKSGILTIVNRYRRAAELPDLLLSDLA